MSPLRTERTGAATNAATDEGAEDDDATDEGAAGSSTDTTETDGPLDDVAGDSSDARATIEVVVVTVVGPEVERVVDARLVDTDGLTGVRKQRLPEVDRTGANRGTM